MPELLGLTNPIPGQENTNVNRNLPITPNDTRIQNAPDPTRVSRPDNRTERQDNGDQTGAGGALRYDSNFRTFLQRLGSTQDLSAMLTGLMTQYSGTVVSSGLGEGIATEMAALMSMLQLEKLFVTQLDSGNRFGGGLFKLLRQAYSASNSPSVKSNILQFAKRYVDHTSSRHIEHNLLRTLTRLSRSIPASYGNKLLPMVGQLQENIQREDRPASIKLLQGSILPFLGKYTAQTNDMGLSRALISMLSLDISRYENGSKEGLLQAFHQLNFNPVLRERLSVVSDEMLLQLAKDNTYTRAAESNDFVRQLCEAADRALQGAGDKETQEAFRNIVSSVLINESVYMPLNHMMIPIDWNGRMMFSELWVDPDAEDNLRRGRAHEDNTMRFLFKMDIQGLGFFDIVLTSRAEDVALQVFCPEKVTPFSSIVEGELKRILEENGLRAERVMVQQMERPLTISQVFPRIFEGENSVNVKI